MLGDMSKIERRLRDVADRVKRVREELALADAQLAELSVISDSLEVDAAIGTGLDQAEHRSAVRHADKMRRHRTELVAELARLEAQQDQLLDQMLAEGSRT